MYEFIIPFSFDKLRYMETVLVAHLRAQDVDFKREGYKVKGLGIQIREKIFPARIPLIGKIFAKVVLFGKFTKFAELIVGIKDLR